jgi:DNA modification methylase
MRNTIIQGDIRAVGGRLETASVNCIVTSPPYWGLRDYGGYLMQVFWGQGGDWQPPRKGNKLKHWIVRLKVRAARRGVIYSPNGLEHICAYGLEPAPELYVEHTVSIFRELKRVLRDDGTVWLNLGDSYNTSPPGNKGFHYGKGRTANGTLETGHRGLIASLKPKDLCMIPARVALALQADGWWLRSDIIWHKPSPMPESVTDRPTKSHEYVFLLTKRARYWYDAEAIKEPVVCDRVRGPAEHPDQISTNGNSGLARRPISTTGRNKRSVWSIPTKSYHGAHFAVFPPDLVRPCILAGCPARTCSACGAPWVRVVEREPSHSLQVGNDWQEGRYSTNHHGPSRPGSFVGNTTKTLGHRPPCTCNAPPVPGVVLDPFFGSGTVAQVAIENGRDWLGVELNEDYIKLANKRLAAVQRPLFVE